MSTGAEASKETGARASKPTVTCPECGTVNDADVRFCGHCGAYLEWDDSSRPQSAPASGTRPPAAARADAAGRPDAPGVPPAPDAVHPPAPGAVHPAPEAVQPAPEVTPPRRRAPVELDRAPLPGETVCGQCGAGNAPQRRFCRRCGSDLVDAVVAPPLPWYRRLLDRRERPHRAGERPTVRRKKAWPVRLTVLVLLAGAGYLGARLAWPWMSAAVEAVRDRTTGVEVVNPESVSASSSQPDHPARLARDGATNSFWSPQPAGDARGEFLEASFAEPIRLVALQVYNGSSEEPKPFLTTGRVQSLLVTARTSGGALETRQVSLDDRPGRQDVQLGIADVDSVRLTVVSAFGATPQTRVALGEVAYFRRS